MNIFRVYTQMDTFSNSSDRRNRQPVSKNEIIERQLSAQLSDGQISKAELVVFIDNLKKIGIAPHVIDIMTMYMHKPR